MCMLALMFSMLIVGCSKEQQIHQNTETSLNEAERYVQETNDHWNGVVSVEFFEMYLQNQSLFPENVLRACLVPGQKIDTTIEARRARLETLRSSLQERSIESSSVESVIQVTSTRKIIDANEISVALVIANMGSTVPPNTSYDYLTNSQNRITTSDLFLANWAYQNDNIPGSFIVADDDYIELAEGTLVASAFSSGQNYFVEAILEYSGPPMNFSYFNTYSGTTETITLQTGEVLLYGPETPLGELILDPTLFNESFEGDQITEFVDARIIGPIPGGSSILLQQGTINY